MKVCINEHIRAVGTDNCVSKNCDECEFYYKEVIPVSQLLTVDEVNDIICDFQYSSYSGHSIAEIVIKAQQKKAGLVK